MKFLTNFQNVNYTRGWHFLNAWFFFHKHNIISFLLENEQNSLIFVSNCQNINFPHGWYFLNAQILLHKYAIISPKRGKICRRLLGSNHREKKMQRRRVTWKYMKWKVKVEKYRRFYKYIGNIHFFSGIKNNSGESKIPSISECTN